MCARLGAILAAGAILAGCSVADQGPLSIQPPAGWKIGHQAREGLDFYTVTASAPGGGLLMVSRWPPPNQPAEIPALVGQLADGFLKIAKKSSEFTLAGEEYRIEQFAGGHCQGSSASFQIRSGRTNILQSLFIMSVDGKIWNGQFTGPAESWSQALTALKNVKTAR